MSKIGTLMRLLTSDRKQLKNLQRLKLIKWLKNNGTRIPDRLYLKIMFYLILGRHLSFANPKTFNEKLQWLKIYDRNPLYTTLVDKSLVKNWVAEKIGEEYLIPTIGCWDNPDDIDLNSLPEKFVLKTTQGGAGVGVIICRDKSRIDLTEIKRRLQLALKQNIFKYFREWPYKNVKPRIIAEALLEDKQSRELKDYKFFCFNGEVKALFIASDRMVTGEEVKFDFFDKDFNYLPFTNGHPNAITVPPC